MKTLTTKQQEREERKKKKLAALANLVQLNDHDRLDAQVKWESSERLKGKKTEGNPSLDKVIAEPQVTDDIDDGFTKVSYKKKTKKSKTASTIPTTTDNATIEDEPKHKRAKLTPVGDDSGSSDHSTANSEQNEELKKMKLNLSYEQYKELKRQLRDRKRKLESIPIFRLREFGRRACLDIPQDERTPIFLTDVQHLLMSTLIGKKSPCVPERWCFIEKPVHLSHCVVLIFEGLSLFHYISHESKFESANKIFEMKLELILPPSEKGNIIENLAQVPLTNIQAEKLIREHGSLETAIEMNKDPTLFVNTIFPIETSTPSTLETADNVKPKNLPPEDKFPRTKLLLSALQMLDEGYPLPLRGQLKGRFAHYKFTKDKYDPVTDHSPLFGVDCEMCRTTTGTNELTRISIVNEQLETVYETLVMPTNKIVDYLTRFSGITPEIMTSVTKTLKDVQKEVKELLPADAILVGQSLNSDLNAMRMMHPYVIDTSVCFNLSGIRRRKSKLQTLAMTFLKETIQENDDGHDSIEDSIASLKLVKLKLANDMNFGDEILTQKGRINEIIRLASSDKIQNNLFAHAARRDKRTAIVTTGSLDNQIKDVIKQAETAAEETSTLTGVSLIELQSNKEAIKKAREIALENALTIANLHVREEDFQQDNVEKTVANIDKWIGKMYKTVANNGLFIVIMGGSVECPSGLAQIAIKKELPRVGIDEPITV